MSRSHRGRFIAITNNQWSDLRTLASQHGWEPCGTIDPGLGLVELKSFEKTGWAGGYDCPSFQKTTEVDACALSDCLASALQHYVESETILESEFSGVDAPIVVVLGDRFPMINAHKVLAAYACLVTRLITGQFNPAEDRAIWPSTGNYCRGGIAISRILGCRGVAVLPEGMSQERFDWFWNHALVH